MALQADPSIFLGQERALKNLIDLEKSEKNREKASNLEVYMGGYGSGRRKRHQRIDDCLALDTTWLRKQKAFARPGQRSMGIEWAKNTITDFHEKKERQYHIGAQIVIYGNQGGQFAQWDAAGHVELHYQVSHEHQSHQKGRNHTPALPLVTTSPNYGGVRWWFLAPCCGRRVRVVYLPISGELDSIMPKCRECLELHYPSQCASYIERHKTYERHLLANYGLYWAAHRYDWELKEHYLEMTPELWALRMKSVVDWNTHLLKLIIRTDLMIYRSNLANYKSLRSEEDRRIYLAHMRKQERELNTINMVKLLQQCIEYERLTHQVNTQDISADMFNTYQRLADISPAAQQPEQAENELESKIISLESMLKQVNKAERKLKKAA